MAQDEHGSEHVGAHGEEGTAHQSGAYSREERELLREFVTMTLYISLSLLAVTLAVPTAGDGPSAWTVFLTGVGLVGAHLLAYSMSTRYVNDGVLDAESAKLLGVQAAAGFGVAVLAVLPVLLLPEGAGLELTATILVLIIGVVGFVTARNAGLSRLRSLGYVAVVAVIAAAVLLVKNAVH